MATFSNQIKQLERDLKSRRVPGEEFEDRLHRALAAKLPFSVLPNVVLYRPDHFRSEPTERGKLAYEIDNLFHYRKDAIDHIIVVEAKAQSIQIVDDQWHVQYTDFSTGLPRKKNLERQLVGHAQTILRYLRPLNRNVELRIEAIVVSSDGNTQAAHKEISEKIKIGLLPYVQLGSYIESLVQGRSGIRSTILRVAQSEFLALLRLGIPVPSLGHPEPRHAIQYIERCKREIDRELFRSFSPSKNRWAINGTAGSGKSVLLAYSAAVFACGHEIVDRNNVLSLISHEFRSHAMGIPNLTSRNICVLAMKPKQSQVLEDLYARFVTDFLALTQGTTDLTFLKPFFGVWNDAIGVPKGCNILLLDESHDLSSAGQDAVHNWHKSSEDHYLALACDRHQKIRLVGQAATIMQGLSFRGFTKRLSRNYRNPWPIYAASLALMFRWLAETGPKIIPTKEELQDCLGSDLEVEDKPGTGLHLKIKSDVHPANGWSHCVETFDQCASAYAHLRQQNLNSNEVLWVRFSKEDSEFNYELLSNYTYHNFCTPESPDLVDKYVKGQEFAIVVIEGFPDLMDEWGRWSEEAPQMDENERKMWSFRRELYLCASRATAFLYFICNTTETPPIQRIEHELSQLVDAFSLPRDPSQTHALEWRVTISPTDMKRSLDVFTDLVGDGETTSTNDVSGPEILVEEPIVVKELASKLGLKPYQIIHHLMEINVFTSANQTLEVETAERLAEKLGVYLRITKKHRF